MNSGNRLLNLILRGLSLSCKFLLVFALARMLSGADFGLYNLIVVTTTFVLYLYGLDFYTFASREMILVSEQKRPFIVYNQLALYIFTYFLISPFLLILFFSGKLSWNLLPLFLSIAILQHLAQEINRLLINLFAPLWASFILFIRSGLWCLALIICMFFFPNLRTLHMVFYFWIAGLILAIIVSYYKLYQMGLPIQYMGMPDIKWIKKGLIIALPFLLGTLSLNAISVIDRYWIENHFNLSLVGVYGFFASLTGAILTALDATIFSFTYPKLIKAVGESPAAFQTEYRLFRKHTLIAVGLFSILLLTGIYPIVLWLNNDLYLQYIAVFFILLLSNIFIALSMIAHYALYAQKHDKPIVIAHILSVIILIISLLIFARTHYLAVAVSVCITSLFLFVFKHYCFWQKHVQ
ncbi:hypothetical protein [Neisseria sp. Ec49-e6-T10]|uniref:hypothetical protein n=1 Tax=Neisseria sp. Ec49-e6-T10 TaxID=3140744 RepID=UPI003EBF3BA4